MVRATPTSSRIIAVLSGHCHHAPPICHCTTLTLISSKTMRSCKNRKVFVLELNRTVPNPMIFVIIQSKKTSRALVFTRIVISTAFLHLLRVLRPRSSPHRICSTLIKNADIFRLHGLPNSVSSVYQVVCHPRLSSVPPALPLFPPGGRNVLFEILQPLEIFVRLPSPMTILITRCTASSLQSCIRSFSRLSTG